ncbi:MAG: CBO0543 family protein [Bacillota bacterium]|nr:CBO0543 family protein [Bacillota bacterium]
MEVIFTSKEYIIIAIAWIITIILLVIFIPKDKYREAQVAFGIKQVLTWVTGLTVVELGLLEYPVRLFPYANKTSFTFEYFIYPSICAIFNVHYPEDKKTFGQFLYYVYYCTTMTLIEVIVERSTNIIKYIHWTWYITWITLFFTFTISRKYYTWFFKLKGTIK